MENDVIKTEGGIFIRVYTDIRGKDHVDVYDKNPRGPHEESIHISLKENGSGVITTKSGNEPRETTDTKCFLTTACMKYFQEKFDDNCYELTVLRWFRDNFVSKDDIEYYYEVAPMIVEAINKEEKSDIIYDFIYDNIVDYCIQQIEQGNYDKAYNRYKNSVLIFEKQFLRPVLEQRLVKILKLCR